MSFPPSPLWQLPQSRLISPTSTRTSFPPGPFEPLLRYWLPNGSDFGNPRFPLIPDPP